MIKIDVEGMELDVLRGATESSIGRDRPRLYVESHDEAGFRAGTRNGPRIGTIPIGRASNATPTHLFMPAEQVSLDRRLEHLEARTVVQDYRLQAQLRRSRKAQADTATKLVTATKLADRLKAGLDAALNERAARRNISRRPARHLQ